MSAQQQYSTDLIDFSDLAPVYVLLKVGKSNYLIGEASAGAVTAYENAISNAIRFKNNEASSTNGMAEADPILVAACVYKTDTKDPLKPYFTPGGDPVSLTVQDVKKWPQKVFKAVYDKIKEISPDLTRKIVTVEGLNEQIRKLTEQRDAMLKEQGKTPSETPPNAEGAGTVTSD